MTNYLPDLSLEQDPMLHNMAEEYAASGIPECITSALHLLPQYLQDPIEYTFVNHLTFKDKPLLVTHTADELSIRQDKARAVAACIDIAWSGCIMVDDIYDRDRTRAHQQPTTWIRYGTSRTVAATAGVIGASLLYSARKLGPRQANAFADDLLSSAKSVRQANRLPLDTSLDTFYDNYDLRSAFYTTFPLAALKRYCEAGPQQIAGAQSALRDLQRSGQLLNDLRDFEQSEERLRTDPFSDIRRGVSTVPIHHLWQSVGSRDQERFAAIYGKEDLTPADVTFINQLVIDTGLGHTMEEHIVSLQRDARDQYIEAVDPSDRTLHWLDALLDFMRNKTEAVVAGLGSTAITDPDQ